MSDDRAWQPPASTNGGTDASGTTPAPYQASGAGAPLTAPPAGSWTPPPKPGLIPLRPLTLGAILTAAFQILKRNPKPTFGFAMLVQVLIVVASGLIIGLVSFSAISRTLTASADDSYEVTAGAVGAGVLSTLIPGVLTVIALALVQGILVLEIQRATLGEKLTLGELWKRARGRLAALVGWAGLITVVAVVATALLIGIIVLLTVTLDTLGVVLSVVVGLFGGLLLLVAGAWIGTKLALVPSVLMGERLKLREAIGRSWSLTNGYFWRTFGIQLLVSAIVGVATQLVSTPLQFLAPMIVFIVDPNGTGGPITIILMLAVALVSVLIVLVLSSVAMVVQSATTALIYIDLRMRKEGLDLDLARYVEESADGRHNPSDPYLTTRPVQPQNESPWA